MDLQAAADALGVHYQTAYRWLREGRLAATKVGASYDVTDEALARFVEQRAAPEPPPSHLSVRDWSAQVDRLHAALGDGDELAARRLVDRLHRGGVAVTRICQELLTPALKRIGDEWEAGRRSVAEEHRASAICERLVARIADLPRGRPRGTVLVTTPPGEEHGLPAAMAAAALRADHWRVHHLATQVPADDLLTMAAAEADVVVLSVIYPPAERTANRLADSLRDAGVPVVVGRAGMTLDELIESAREALSRG